MNARAAIWELDAGDAANLIVGRQNTVRLRAKSVTCIDGITLKDSQGKELVADWKAVKPNEVEVKLPCRKPSPVL